MPRAVRWLLRHDIAIDLSTPRLMGILNLTPDSFHAPSRVLDAPVSTAHSMLRDGACILDLGAESTRPGSTRVDAAEQIRRLDHVLREREAQPALPQTHLSIDTTLAPVARHALAHGFHAINDVSAALESPDMLRVAADHNCGLILMHRALPPTADSYSDRYTAPPMTGDAVKSVRDFLLERARAAIDAGINPERIALDPGFGFGKTVQQNLDLIHAIDALLDTGFPILVGLSRKSFVGRLGDPARDTTPAQRLPASIALALHLATRGVRIFRVHDVAEHAQAFRAWQAAEKPGTGHWATAGNHPPSGSPSAGC